MPNDWGQEIDSLESWIVKNPDSIVFAHLADCYLHTEDVDRAIEICEQGLQKYPDYPSVYYVLAKCHLAKRQYEEAEKRLKKVLMLDPKFLKAHKRYGDLMQEIGWDKSSEMSYKRVLEIDPLDEETRITMDNLRSHETMEVDDLADEETLIEPEYALEDSEELIPEPESLEPPPEGEEQQDQIEDIEEDLEEVEPNEFEEEEERFSSILDDLFGSKIAEEEKQEEETLKSIERAAQLEKGTQEEAVHDEVQTITEKTETQEITEAQNLKEIEEPPAESTDVESKESPFPELEPKGTSTIPEEFSDLSSFETEDENLFADEIPDEPLAPSPLEAQADTDTQETSSIETEDIGVTDSVEEKSIEPDLEKDPDVSTESAGMTPDDLPIQEIETSVPKEFLGIDDDIQDEELAFGSVLDDLKESQIEYKSEEESGDRQESEPKHPPVEDEVESAQDIFPQQESEQDKKEKIVTPTLGEIFAAQGQYAKAISVFEKLHQKDPANQTYLKKIEELKRKMEESSD